MRKLPPRLLVAAFWLALAVILFLALKPSPPRDLFNHADKLYHALAFTTLTLMARFAYPAISWRRLTVSILGIGVIIEWGQMLAPARTSSMGDLLSNTLGFALGALLLWLWRRRLAPQPGPR